MPSSLLKQCEAILTKGGFQQPKEEYRENLPDGVKRTQIWRRDGKLVTEAIFLEEARPPTTILLHRATYSAPDRGDNEGSWYAHRRNVLITDPKTLMSEVEKLLRRA